MSEAITSGNVAIVLVYANNCGMQGMTKKVCAATSRRTGLMAHGKGHGVWHTSVTF